MPYREPHNQDELDSSGSLLSRICKKCGVRKTPEEFHFTGDKTYRRRTCKRCAGVMRKANLASKPPGEWEEHLRKSHLRRKYGISSEEFYKLLKSQEGRCSICRVEMDSTTRQNAPKKVQVDHDHKTGQVRGLLCFSCNTGLGKFRDSEELLHKAIAYLKDPPNVQYRDKFLGERERHHSKIAAQRMVEECPETIPRAPREHPRRLSSEEKALIREEYLTGEVTQRYLSIRWGCHSSTISVITSEERSSK